MAHKVLRRARGSLADTTGRSDYEDRLVWALSRPRLRFGERYLVASAVGAYVRAEQPYVGSEGERLELEVWVEVASRRARKGRFGDSYFHRMRDCFGRLVIWYATGKRLERGARYVLRGTVRRRGAFGKQLATVVHRCRVDSS